MSSRKTAVEPETTVDGWSTIDVAPTPSSDPWRRSMGLACPHGREFFLVDGTYIRNNFDSDFVQGGNGYRYRFCSKSHLWLDDSIPEEEFPFVAFHECHEAELMKDGLDYETAHDKTKRLEDKYRRLYYGGRR